jgi:hypothetical protein
MLGRLGFAIVSALVLAGCAANWPDQAAAVLAPAVVFDPISPNWQVEETALGEDTYQLTLRAKSYRYGGDGEAIQIVKRRALQLQKERGYTDYRILDYTESIDSGTPFTHRTSQATIRLVNAQPLTQ